MKTLLIAALLVTVAVAAASDNFHVHLHMDKPITDKRFGGFVNRMVESMLDTRGVEVHFHVPSGNDEIEFGFFDKIKDIGKAIGGEIADIGKKVGEEIVDAGKKAGDGIVDVGKKIGDGVVDVGTKAGDGIVDVGKKIGDGVVKGFDVTKDGINVAIRETENAFNKVKNEISSIKLPHITIPELIEKIIQIVDIIERLIPCAQSLQKAMPFMISFAKSAAAEDAAGAVLALLSMLQFMPDITEKCVGQPFSIPKETMDKIQCAADIVALTAIVVQFVVFPENVIGNMNGLKSMIEMIPRTISDCTGAFA